MTSESTIFPLLWNWYVMFVWHMGYTLAVTVPFSLGVLLNAWFYRQAKAMATAPLPHPLMQQLWQRVRFFFLLALAVLTVIGCLASFYLLGLGVVEHIRPQPMEIPADLRHPYLEMDFLDPAWTSIILHLTVLSAVIMLGIFGLLLWRANSLGKSGAPLGPVQRFVKIHFYDYPVFGFLFIMAWWWFLWNLLMEVNYLGLIIKPEIVQTLLRHPLPLAERFQFSLLKWLWLALVTILVVPLVLLYLRGVQLSLRQLVYFLSHLDEYFFWGSWFKVMIITNGAMLGIMAMLWFELTFFHLVFGVP